jgi:hypothetical protein
MHIYYVYQYLRENGTPYYIGKGKEKRAWSKYHSVKLPKNPNNIQIIKENISEKEAHNFEMELIAKYGRKNNKTGILHNKTDGGEGVSGRIYTVSEETKLKISKSTKGREGKLHTIESKLKLSIAGKGRKPWNKGLNKEDPRVSKNAESRSKVIYSEETKKSFRKPKSEQGKLNMSIGQKGKKYPKIPCKCCGLLYPSNSMSSHLKTHKNI